MPAACARVVVWGGAACLFASAYVREAAGEGMRAARMLQVSAW